MKTSHKFLSFLFVSVLLFSFTKPVYQANFSGTWTLNEGKSELGQFGARGSASKIVVDQKADGVSVSRTSTGFDGNATTTSEILANDGKESETTVFGTAKKKSSLKWAADGNNLTITFTIVIDRGGQTTELKGTETWSLGSDGKTLALQNALSTPQGDISTKAVYDKQ
ncbi:MAG: hypothetical protein ABIS69_06480 [Sediminibacterium sp.]